MNVVIVFPQSVAFTPDRPGAQFARDDVALPEPAIPDALGSAPLRTVLTKNPVIVHPTPLLLSTLYYNTTLLTLPLSGQT